MHSTSITARFCLVILLVLALLSLAGYFLLNNVYRLELRNQANTVADNVSSFGSWVARYGRVWVSDNSADSFLGSKEVVDLEHALEGFDNQKSVADSSYNFYSKNPALAQREFSEVVAASDSPAKFRLTSDNFMNPANQPDAFETEAINAIRQSGEGYYETFNTVAGEYRFARAVVHKASCIACHGDPSTAPRDVINRYGDQRGYGFSEGDLAGVISVTLPMVAFRSAVLPFIGIREVLLVIAAFLLAVGFLQFVVLAPLKRLTQDAEAASMGDTYDIDLGKVKQTTRNEIERLGLSIKRLNTSSKIAIDRMRENSR
ncbi:MAG: DUF3365 domain-containing protein [Pseudomonadota bacterium]